jgi:hypothetical protein
MGVDAALTAAAAFRQRSTSEHHVPTPIPPTPAAVRFP